MIRILSGKQKKRSDTGVAGAFPFASYELSDSGGIFLGLNLYNRSPVLIDFYDDYKYTNGNFAVFGSTGAGKSTICNLSGNGCGNRGARSSALSRKRS